MRLGEVALFTSQVAVVTKFYGDLLGSAPVISEIGKSVFVLDGAYVLIHEGKEPRPYRGPLFDEDGFPPDRDHFAFHVTNLDAHCAALRSKGIDIEVREFPWGRAAYLLDPDGRVVEIQGSDALYGS